MFGSLHYKYDSCCQYYCENSLAVESFDRFHQGENWKSFGHEWKFYELAAGIHKKAQEVWVASLLNMIRNEEMDMYETFQWGNSCFKTDKVLEKFEEHCVPVHNETYKRHVFFKREQLSK